jgi:hypothetical protein
MANYVIFNLEVETSLSFEGRLDRYELKRNGVVNTRVKAWKWDFFEIDDIFLGDEGVNDVERI